MPIKTQSIETGNSREVRKLKALHLNVDKDQCIRVSVRRGGPAREFMLCAVGGSGKPGALQVMTPDVRKAGEPYGQTTRQLLVGDNRKMCRFGWPMIHYEADLLPEYRDNIDELHGARSRKRHRLRRAW